MFERISILAQFFDSIHKQQIYVKGKIDMENIFETVN